MDTKDPSLALPQVLHPGVALILAQVPVIVHNYLSLTEQNTKPQRQAHKIKEI